MGVLESQGRSKIGRPPYGKAQAGQSVLPAALARRDRLLPASRELEGGARRFSRCFEVRPGLSVWCFCVFSTAAAQAAAFTGPGAGDGLWGGERGDDVIYPFCNSVYKF